MKMATDFYTKAVLTIIAACLVYIVFKDISIVPQAQARTPSPPSGGGEFVDAGGHPRVAPPPATIAAAGKSQVIDVNIVSIAGQPFGFGDVGITSPYLPVRVFGR